MNAVGDVVIVEIPCISCGYNLHMLPAEGRCPECGASVADSVRDTLLAGGQSHLRRLARALMFASCLNIGLVIGCLLAVGAGRRWRLFLFFLFFAAYAWLLVFAASQTTRPRPGESSNLQRCLILLSGLCFAATTLVPLFMVIPYVLQVWSDVPEMVGALIVAALFPGLAVFAWTLGERYAQLCTTAGMHGLARWSKRIGRVTALGVGVMEIGFVVLAVVLLKEPLPSYYVRIIYNLSFAGGLLVLVVAMLAATLLQFVLARRFKELAKRIGETPVLTGPPPT